MWLLFPFSRRFRLYDHTVFVTYSLCFMMLLLAGGDADRRRVSGAGEPRLVRASGPHVPPARGAYGLGWRAVAHVVLTIFAFIAISLFASLLVGLGVFD